MTADSKTTNTASDYIDLLVLAERILLFFRKYKWTFIIAIILGLSSGILVYRLLPNVYKSRLIAHSFILTNQEDIQIIQNWNELLGKGEYTELSTALNCPENILHLLKKISADEIQKVFNAANPHGFIIEVTISDNSILDELEKGIIYGLENSPYIKERLETKRANLNELIDKTGIEIQKLDSSKKAMENIIGGKGKSSSSLIVDGTSINNELIAMNEKHLGYKEELKFSGAIQVLQSFNKFRQPAGPKLIPWLIIGLLFFLSIAFISALYRSIKEKLKNRLPS